MSTRRTTRRMRRGWPGQVVLLAALFAWLLPQRVMADDMYESRYFTMSTSTDHLSFEVLLTDLNANNTWAKDGTIKAYSEYGRNGDSYELIRVYTKEEDDDDVEYYNVFVTNKRSTAKVWLTNAQYGSKEIGTSEVEDKVYKGSSADRTYAKLDYYYGPELADKKWYFYYEFKHNNNKTRSMYLGASTPSATMGLKTIDLKNYRCERTGPKQFTFIPPALPGDVPDKVKDIRKRFGEYKVTLTFHPYSGSDAVVSETFPCKESVTIGAQTESYRIDIPASVGNYKSVDLKVEAVERLDGSDGSCYWKNEDSFNTKNLAPTVPVPNSINPSFLQFDNKVELSWNTFTQTTAEKYYTDSEPYVYRIELDENGQPLSGQSWSRRTRLDSISTKTSLTYADRGAEMNKYYRYMIVNVPKSWLKGNFISDAELKSPDDDLLQYLGYCQSDIVKTEPTVNIYDLTQDKTVTNKVRLTWKYSRVPVRQQSVNFVIWRRKAGSNQWAKYGQPISADANPTPNTVTEFIDEDLPNYLTKYEYKVELTIYDFNTFKSNEVTACLIDKTTITEMKATQGTYNSVVSVSWKVRQIGTDETVYRLYRYLVGQPDKSVQIYDESGTRDGYTYEDKNVEPGKFYEYRLEAHTKSNDASVNTLQDYENAVGFSKSSGTARGRITFGSGSNVEGVRVSLRSESQDAIKSYSQRVDGPSTGIQWNADTTQTAKLFGPDKNFTVQMFVRPDSALTEGAVISEIPGEGRLVVGKQTAADYELQLSKPSYVEPVVVDTVWSKPEWVPPVMEENTVDLSKLTGDYEAKNGDVLTNKLAGNYKISIANGATVKLKNATIDGVNSQDCKWAGITCSGHATLVLEGTNTVKGFYEDYPGIFIDENYTLTIKGTGTLNVSSNGYAAGIGGGNVISCGNIIIEGGTINATGGEYGGTAIGGGWKYRNYSAGNAFCGNITISGGTVNAVAQAYDNAAIGSAKYGYCGRITITGSVTNVTAIVTDIEDHDCIGNSYGGDCGTITIGGEVTGSITQNPFVYDGDGSWAANDHSNSDAVFTHVKEPGYYTDPEVIEPGYIIPGYFTYGTATKTGVTLPSNKYSLLTVDRMGNNLSFQVNDGEAKTLTALKYNRMAPFSVGGADSVKTDAQAFRGNLTEVRVWNYPSGDKEERSAYIQRLQTYNDRVLNGLESKLSLYWPMSEGLEHFVFDASYGSEPNGRHATVGVNVSTSTLVPTDDQLSRYAVTDKSGEYLFQNIPYTGIGSTYTLTPTLGIHVFQPESRSGFIGKDHTTLDNYDFTDQSSFPLRGQVTYLGTSIPVDSVQFMIDGDLVQSKDGVYSDANGKYEISVPIGPHLIECMKDGHRLTTFPLDKTEKHDFRRAETVNFVDSTLVNVTGRVNGGFSDAEEPVGFALSQNRIGKAEIKLSIGKETDCSFNYWVNDRGEPSFGTEDIPVESASKDIKSTAYRSGTTHDKITDNDNTHYIYITTDSLTGEFSAMLPPLKYVVESIRLVGGSDYNDEPVFAQNLPVIDATNTKKDQVKYDSVTVDGTTKKYEYVGKMLRQLRVQPDITVKQLNLPAGMFGEVKVAYTDDKFQTDSIVALDTLTTDAEKRYRFKHPVFVQRNSYEFSIDVAENYINQDTRKTFKEYPKDALIHISNDASATTTIYGQKAFIGNDSVDVGMPYETMQIEITPDEYGHAEYEFVAGAPNMAESHLLGMSVSVHGNDGRTTMWKAPDSQSEALDLIVLGAVGSGTNFITEGPDEVDMILRRPPGSTSVARLTSKEVKTVSHTKIHTSGTTVGGGLYISETPTFDNLKGPIGPIALLQDTKWKIITTQTLKSDNRYSDTETAVNDSAYTVTKDMATPGDMQWDAATNSYVPEAGDTYIGRSTNMLYSKGRILGIFKNEKGEYAVGERSGITVGQELRTYFVFPQSYILNTLIPEWQALIRSRLEEGYIEADHTVKANCPEVAGKVIYYTKYKPGDRQFGKCNGDMSFWTKKEIEDAGGCPSYRLVDGTAEKNAQDEVQNAVNQIKRWREVIAANEAEKVNAFGDSDLLIDNFSIASGSSISRSEEWSATASQTVSTDSTYYTTLDVNLGFMINDAGSYGIVNSSWTKQWQRSNASSESTTTSVAWTMSDADARSALSVDVYRSPNGWGPIFRTRGGQTACPYEAGSETKFYDPGTKLNEATMRVEKPEMTVNGATEITDVPTGGKALFDLEMSNQSETDNVCTYVLQVVEGSNPDGAVLTIDGNILSNGNDGRPIRFKAKETIHKTLVVTQSNEAVTNYNDIELILRSENDKTTVSNPVKLRVHFVPASSPVELAVDHTVLNAADKKLYGGVTATMSELDRNGNRLKGLRLRYRRKGTDQWKQLAVWSNEKAYLQQGADSLPNGSVVKHKVSFTDDGLYELQAQTWGLYGQSTEVTYESNIIDMTQDTHGPKLLGMVSPEDGRLTWLNRNNMHIRLNEVLNANALSQSENIIIEGGLNNVVLNPNNPYPDVAVQLNGDSIGTQAMYDLTNSDYAFDMWFYRQGDGNIISLGTDNNLLALSTHDGGKLRARVGGKTDVFETGETLPENQWLYMALNYRRKTADDQENRISMLYTVDKNDPVWIGKNMPAEDLNGHGKLTVGGGGMQGMVGRVSIWNSDVTADNLYKDRNKQRAAFTPGLVGYWKMDEGHGTQATDIARSRHIYMDSESWYINNENRAVHLDGTEGSALKVDVSTFQPANTDNFAYEMWFRGTAGQTNNNAALMSVNNRKGGMTTLGFEEGKLTLTITDESTTLSEKNYLDGNWHHTALNVRRGTSAIAYVDGEPVKVLPENTVPGIESLYLTVGAELVDTLEQRRFTGDVDEVRIWEAALDGQLIKERRYERLDNSYPGLEGYFPMEDIHRSEQGNVKTYNSLGNFGESESRLKIIYGKLGKTSHGIEVEHEDTTKAFREAIYEKLQANNAPALKPGSSKMRLANTDYDITVSSDELYFTFPDGTLQLMDDNDFVATVSNIKDEHGNKSEPVSWQFHCDFASLKWSEEEETLSKPWNEAMDWQVYISNQTGTAQSYELSGMPTWMTADKPIGTITGYGDFINFRLGTDVPIGRHTEYIYLTDQLGIRRVMKLILTVTGNVPDWAVDTDLYESNMTMTGQIYINDKICENTDTKIAAFDELGLCRGVASPKYVNTRDAYYVDMVLYGASATELSTGVSALEFKLYDASAGTIRPLVGVLLPGQTEAEEFKYIPDANFGSYDTPVVFKAFDVLEENVQLAKGWTWMSFYVEPLIPELQFVLPKDVNILKRFNNIKSQSAFATVDKNGVIQGELTAFETGKMYKMQLTTKTNFTLIGMTLNVDSLPQTMHPGYNWIGTVSNSVMSVDEAFAELQPEPGDRVKSRTAFAEFSNKGYWEGTLESIVPGQGYIYRSMADKEKTFHYPRGTAGTAQARATTDVQSSTSNVQSSMFNLQSSMFNPVDPYTYPDNLNIIAVVKKDGRERDDAEIGAFIDNECRGAIGCNNGYYFLTAMGSSETDGQKKMELRVYLDGEEYMVDDTLPFISDAFYGSLDKPYVLDVDAITGIRVVSASPADDDSDWYTLQGFKIGRKPTKPGVYLHHGQKVTIKKKQ